MYVWGGMNDSPGLSGLGVGDMSTVGVAGCGRAGPGSAVVQETNEKVANSSRYLEKNPFPIS